MNINVCIFAGTLGEGEVRDYKGKKFWKGTLQVVETWRSEKGTQRKLHKIPLECGGKNAMLLAQLAPGSLVNVQGKFQSREWTSDQSGKTSIFYSIMPLTVELLSQPRQQQRQAPQTQEDWEMDAGEEAF